jgi:hypothetical protein
VFSANCIRKNRNCIKVFETTFYNLVEQYLITFLLLNFDESRDNKEIKVDTALFYSAFAKIVKIEPMFVATKVTGSQVVEVTVMAYVLSTRSGMQKKLTSPLFKGNQLHGNNPIIGQFFCIYLDYYIYLCYC